MTFFVLLNSPIPTEKELADLRVKLTDEGEDQMIDSEKFKTVSFWFDQSEGKPSPTLEAKWLAEKHQKRLESGEETESEEEDDEANGIRLDLERLVEIKALLFDIHRISTGEDRLSVQHFVETLVEAGNMASAVQGAVTFSDSLFANE